MSEIDAALARLRERFIARCADDSADLRRWARDPAEASADLARRLHRIAGAAGTFGFPSLSERAKRLEAALAAGDADALREVTGLADELAQLATRRSRAS